MSIYSLFLYLLLERKPKLSLPCLLSLTRLVEGSAGEVGSSLMIDLRVFLSAGRAVTGDDRRDAVSAEGEDSHV